jgi:hypothetical protein
MECDLLTQLAPIGILSIQPENQIIKNIMNKIKTTLTALALSVGFAFTASGQSILINSLNETSITSFSDWGGTLPTGFTIAGPDAAITYRGETASTTGGVYNISGFDWQASSSANSITLTGSYQNLTGTTITTLEFSYDAFLVVERASRLPAWSVSVNSVSQPDLTWTKGDDDKTLFTTIAGLNIEATDIFTIAFSSDRGTGSGSSPMIGLNNVSITAVPEPATYAAIVGLLALGLVLVHRRMRM